MESLARAATLLEADPQALEMSTPREENAPPDFATFTPQMFKERFLTQLMNNPIGGDPAWCFDIALKYKKSTGQYCRAFFKLCLRRMIYFHARLKTKRFFRKYTIIVTSLSIETQSFHYYFLSIGWKLFETSRSCFPRL